MGRYYYDDDDFGWPPYVPVAERRARAARTVARMKKSGQVVAPVQVTGRKIARTFWGEAWCRNLEAYSDYANRLPRGRSYVRNGAVLDLQIEAGRVRALVSGTRLYTVDIAIQPLPAKQWKAIRQRCAGQIDSLLELLRGRISGKVMEIVTRRDEGLFPAPRVIALNCSCPDWATMCKHVAATLYGIGARLDHEPGLLFLLRGVDAAELVESAIAQPPAAGKARSGRVLDAADLSSVFGVDIEPFRKGRAGGTTTGKKTARKKTTAKKTTAKKTTAKKAAKRRPAA